MWEEKKSTVERTPETFTVWTEYSRHEFILEFCNLYIKNRYLAKTKHFAKVIWIYDTLYWQDNIDK